MSAPPYMKLFWGDYHKATRHLTRDQHGAYFLLIGEAWHRGGSLPDDDAKLAAWALCTREEWAAIKPTIMDFFALRRGKWWHDRVRDELASYEATSRKRKQAGKKGGSVSNGTAKGNTEANANHLPTKPEPEPFKEDTPIVPKGTKTTKVSKEQVEQVWSACPAMARQRSSRADIETALNSALRRGHEPEAVLAGLLAAYRSDTYAGDRAKGIHRLIDKDRWQSFTEVSASSPLPAGPAFDPAVRASIVRVTDDEFAKRYVDHYCRWLPDGRRLEARTPAIAAALTQRLAGWAVEKEVVITVASANDAKPDLFERAAS